MGVFLYKQLFIWKKFSKKTRILFLFYRRKKEIFIDGGQKVFKQCFTKILYVWMVFQKKRGKKD